MMTSDRTHRPPRVLFLGALLGLFALSCEHAGPLEVGSDATLSNIQANIFTTSCAFSQCHGGDFPKQGLDLTAGRSYASLVGVQSQERPALDRIEPGEPDNSYLYLKITGDPSIAGDRMPFGAPALSSDKIDLIRQWIIEGAQNN